jgi:AraC-like DNA-binding protein
VSTYGKGIYDIGQHADVRQVYTTADGMLKDDHVYTTFFDRDGSLWVGTLNGDLLQKKGAELIYYPIHDVQSITQLASGQIAVGTAFGLKLITPENGRVRELNYAPSGVTDINPFVNHLMSHGLELWIATDGGGIYIYHQAERECRQITKKDGLPSNHVSSLITGKDGRIWIATENGLAYISPDEPSKIVNVNYCYGLDREYVRGAVANLSGGDIIFGTTTGAVIIHPADVQPLNYTAHLQFLDVDAVAHQDDGFNEEVHRMLASGELKLSYRQRTFNLYFESVNMRNHFDIVYRYRVGKGEWSQPSDQQYIRFTNLESGEHLLTLQCVSRTSGVVIDTAKLTIVISQPWWNSWWMWVVYICLIALLFYGAWRVYELHEKYMRLTIDHLQVATSPQASDNEPSVDDKAGDSGKDFIDKVTMLVAEHLGDSQFSIDQLCREMAMSRTLFYVKLKSYTGKSPQDFIRIVRLEHAASMLRNGRSVTDASALAGFDNPKYFSTVFKKYFGVSPSKYQ